MRTHSLTDRIRAAVAAFRDPRPTAQITVNVDDSNLRRVTDNVREEVADEFDTVANRIRHRHRVDDPTEHVFDGAVPQDVAADLSDRITDAVDGIPDDALIQSIRIDAPNDCRVVYVEPDRTGVDE